MFLWNNRVNKVVIDCNRQLAAFERVAICWAIEVDYCILTGNNLFDEGIVVSYWTLSSSFYHLPTLIRALMKEAFHAQVEGSLILTQQWVVIDLIQICPKIFRVMCQTRTWEEVEVVGLCRAYLGKHLMRAFTETEMCESWDFVLCRLSTQVPQEGLH